MLSQEEMNIIERLNANLGTKHRGKPYDYKDPGDLREMLLISVAAYRDYDHYMRTVSNVQENFDESLEHYDTLTWLDMGDMPDSQSNIAMESLGQAFDAFYELCSRAERTCAAVLKAILSAADDVQKNVLGQVYSFTPDEVNDRIGSLFAALEETTYHHAMPDNLAAFLELMKSEWS